MKFLTLFNNKGGVGKTTLVYHLAWMFSQQGYTVLAADVDPQCNLTSMFLSEDDLEESNNENTIYTSIAPLLKGTGDIHLPNLIDVTTSLKLIAGDLRLSLAEDELSRCWPNALDGDERAFRVLSSFYRIISECAHNINADIVFVDVGPNLGSLNRTAIIVSDFIITPLAPDLYSLQGLKNLGPRVRSWRKEWKDRKRKNPEKDLLLPSGEMVPLGYIVMQHSERIGTPTKSYHKWIDKIPPVFHADVLGKTRKDVSIDNDTYLLAKLKHYRSLMPMAMEARKPIFNLTPADGAFGSHAESVANCRKDFKDLVKCIADRIGLSAN